MYFSSPTICPVCKEGKKFVFIRDFAKNGQKHSLHECSACQTQFWLPSKNPGNKWYEKSNPYNVRELAGSKISRGYHKDFLKRHKSLPKGLKVLDLGCGTGEFISELEKRGCEAWGMDFDSEAIKIAKNRFGLKNVYEASFEEFFKKKDLPQFDMITFFEVIEHLEKPLDFILSAKKLLAPGGELVLSAPCRERFLANLNGWDFPPHHFSRFNQESILNLFGICGFSPRYINYVEQFKILSESFSGILKTGIVGKSLETASSKGKSFLIPQIIYFIGRLKYFVLGGAPALFFLIFGKIIGRRNGIMVFEFQKKVEPKVIFFIPTLSIGGGERVVSELSLNLPNLVKKTIVLFKNQISYPYAGKLVSLDIPIANPFVLKIYYFFVGFFRFKKVFKQENPDFVVSFTVPAGVINVLTNDKAYLRVDNTMSTAHGLLYRLLIRFFYKKAKKIICVSKSAAEDLIKNFNIKKENIEVIYNPINIKKIQELAQEPLESEYQEIFKHPVIITTGRLTKQKGQWHLIKAFGAVKKTIKDAKLVILGAGEMEKELKQLAKDSKIEEDVHFLGWQENPFKFLAKSAVFALSSLWEGLPYALLEAMACGLPIVSADCKSGPREILAPKTNVLNQADRIEFAEFGILTRAFDGKKNSEEILKEAIVKVLTDKNLAASLSDKSRQRAFGFDIKNIIKEWDFLQKVV